MNDKSVKALAEMMATATILTPEFNTYACVPQRKTKERTIRKCANPEKKGVFNFEGGLTTKTYFDK